MLSCGIYALFFGDCCVRLIVKIALPMIDGNVPERTESVTVPTYITVPLKQDKPNAPDWECTARIMSLAAIPAPRDNRCGDPGDSRSKYSHNYVQLAVSTLTAEKSKTPQDLRDWAVDLLDANSPVTVEGTEQGLFFYDLDSGNA
jgi:hypothetical protein